MMASWQPWKVILLGFVMTLLGVVIPTLMILQVIKSTFFLNFLAYTLSMGGMLIGFIGMTFIIRLRKE